MLSKSDGRLQGEGSGEGSLELARLFRYLAQGNDRRLRKRFQLDEVPYKGFHSSHRKAFDKLAFIFSKYGVDAEDFLRFILKRRQVSVPELILKPEYFLEYAKVRERNEQLSKIYGSFMKSVENIARMCVERGETPKEFMRELISGNRMAYEYVSGRISKYFLVSLGNFRDIYWTLDQMNREELGIIYTASEELSGALLDAFLLKTGARPRPIRAVEDAIEKLKLKEKENTKQEK